MPASRSEGRAVELEGLNAISRSEGRADSNLKEALDIIQAQGKLNDKSRAALEENPDRILKSSSDQAKRFLAQNITLKVEGENIKITIREILEVALEQDQVKSQSQKTPTDRKPRSRVKEKPEPEVEKRSEKEDPSQTLGKKGTERRALPSRQRPAKDSKKPSPKEQSLQNKQATILQEGNEEDETTSESSRKKREPKKPLLQRISWGIVGGLLVGIFFGVYTWGDY